MNARTPPPVGLRWTATWPARALSVLLAVASLLVSGYVGYRYVGLIDCLREQAAGDQKRTAAIAAATDAERRADLDLIRGGTDPHMLRAAAIDAREHTDAVRAAYPAPAAVPCQ